MGWRPLAVPLQLMCSVDCSPAPGHSLSVGSLVFVGSCVPGFSGSIPQSVQLEASRGRALTPADK